MSASDVVITGIGLVTPVGQRLDDVFDAMCHGRSGLVTPPAGHRVEGTLEVMGEAPPINPASVMPGPEARTVDRFLVMALTAAADAMIDADLVVGRDVDPYRACAIISSTGGLEAFETQVATRTQRGKLSVSPYLMPGMLPNMGASRIAIKYNLRGYSSAAATACAAGAQSIAEGVRLLRSGDADAVVVGCSEAPLFQTIGDSFANARALANGWENPTMASRPFDLRRNGLVLAEGAAVMVLERAETADARGRAAYATVLGWGATMDAHHPTTPRPDGTCAAEAMRRALANAGVSTSDIGYINAHGTGTKLGDLAESKAVAAVFGPDGPPISSTKGVTGHMLGASGMIETAVVAMAVANGLLPPTHNLDEPDPACGELDHIRGKARESAIELALTNAFGFGGHNVSLVIGRPTTQRSRFEDAVPGSVA